ncbi:DUF2977 domain-containing protein [Staphylococcus sp. GDY8P120P]|uniref:DUF2977 domain-containing protein n=1 Tax=Staphylococcus sp. GDY8P120P TaxID=2804156 RepID=UPI001AEC694C|nr:DUF2977 domain-containing protein [Staphylococcus sp. GDY8P120P]
MQILLNDEREITNYAIVGGFEDGIEIESYPNYFINNFKPRYYVFSDNAVKVNKNYKEKTDEVYEQPEIDLDKNTKGLDKELRNMFASMQIQIVQGNMMVSQFSQQNAKLAQELVRLQKELEDMKGDK